MDLIGSKAAAELLNKSRSQVNRDAAAGLIPAERLESGAFVFDRAEIERLASLPSKRRAS